MPWRAWWVLLVCVTSVSCSCDKTVSWVDLHIDLLAVSIPTLYVGDTVQLIAFARAGGGVDGQCYLYASHESGGVGVEPDSFTFTSSRPDVATVTNRGLLIAVQSGQTEVWATTQGMDSDKKRLTIMPARYVAPPNMRLKLTARVD